MIFRISGKEKYLREAALTFPWVFRRVRSQGLVGDAAACRSAATNLSPAGRKMR
jgi:hypothetical protein